MPWRPVSCGLIVAILLVFFCVASARPVPAQTAGTPDSLPVIPMPPDRADDSYQIYSLLMPVGELGDPGFPHALWLIGDTTHALIASGQPCTVDPATRDSQLVMDPHVGVHPDAAHTQDFAEILDDFDRHCHDRIQLSEDAFHLTVPFHLLDDAEQREFMALPRNVAMPAKYQGAPGLSSFSEVYFNGHHTAALVYASAWCGGLCAQQFWAAFELKDGRWHRLDWKSSFIVS
jgi:hypothetical protein